MSGHGNEKDAEFSPEVYDVGTIWTTKQVKEMECGPCCMGIVLRQLEHPAKNTSVSMLRQYSQQYPGGYRPSPQSVHGATPSLLSVMFPQPKIGSYIGTQAKNLAATLNGKFYEKVGDGKWEAYSCHNTKDLKTMLKAYSPSNPCICQVEWDNGGSHFIVGLGAEGNKDASSYEEGHDRRRYYFSDPFYGLQWIHIPHEDSGTRLTYWPINNATKQWGNRGKFMTWIVYQE